MEIIPQPSIPKNPNRDNGTDAAEPDIVPTRRVNRAIRAPSLSTMLSCQRLVTAYLEIASGSKIFAHHPKVQTQ